MKEVIAEYKTADDGVEIVLHVENEVIRCKDCKFAHMTAPKFGREPECKYCDIWFPNEKVYLEGNYYCASAERKEE